MVPEKSRVFMKIFPSAAWRKGHFPPRYYARVLAQSICAVCVVSRPFSRFGNEYAFFAITCYELVFSPQNTLAQTFECIMLHLAGGFIGIAISALARFLAFRTDPSSLAFRAIPAAFLSGITLIAGYLKSRLPRLVWSMRILIFVSIWMLTAPSDDSISKLCTSWIWVLLVASIASLFSSLLLLSWSSSIAASTAATFELLHVALNQSLQDIFKEESVPSSEQNLVHTQLLKRSHNLTTSYQIAAFELRLGFVPVKSLKPFISVIEHSRQELSLLPTFFIGALDPSIKAAFHAPAQDLSSALLESMTAIQNIILACYGNSLKTTALTEEKSALLQARSRLEISQKRAKRELGILAGKLNSSSTVPLEEGAFGFPDRLFDLSLLMISFLQLAQEMHYALRVGLSLQAEYKSASLRLFHPRWSLAWLGASPDIFVMEARGPLLEDAEDAPRKSLTTSQETRQGLAEQQEDRDRDREDAFHTKEAAPYTLGEHTEDRPNVHAILPHHHRSLFPRLWNSPRVLRRRLWLSENLRKLQNSKHVEHALKNAIGLSILSVPFFLPPSNKAYQNFTWIRGQWMLVSFIWVLEANVGSTFRVGYLRLSGTAIGAVYAYIATLIARLNPYLIVFFVILAELPISWIVINTDFPSLGVVAAVTLPPIILAEYINPDQFISSWQLALFRAGTISAGILAALTINSLFFPSHARVQFLDSVCGALGTLNAVYVRHSRDLISQPSTSMAKEKKKTLKLELRVRHTIHRMDVLLATLSDELSLVPKPMRKYRDLVNILQKLQDLLAGIRKIREHIPRRETVLDVLPERRELISCICITLFACEQGFRARQALPQFLPSVRRAFLQLEHAIEDKLHHLNESRQTLGLPMIYSLAEMDTLRETVDCLGDLADVARALFGTANWYQETSRQVSQVTTITSPIDENEHPVRPPGPIRLPSSSLFFDRTETLTPY